MGGRWFWGFWHFESRLVSIFDPCPPSVTPSFPVLMGYCLFCLDDVCRPVWQIQHCGHFSVCISEAKCGQCQFIDDLVDPFLGFPGLPFEPGKLSLFFGLHVRPFN
jgi:hypothetical protein